MKKLIALTLALLMALSFALVGCGKNDDDKEKDGDTSSKAEDVAKAYVTAYGEGNFKKAEGYVLLSIQQSLEAAAKQNDLTVDDYLESVFGVSNVNEFLDQYEELFKAAMEEEFGENVKCSIEGVKEVDEYSSEKLENFKKNYKSNFDEYGLDIDKVDAVTDVTLEATLSGSKKTETDDDISITVVKYNGDWKVLETED